MPTIYEAFGSDEKFETGGVIVDYGDLGRFKIARAGGSNEEFGKRARELQRPHKHAIEAGSLPTKVGRDMMARLYADTIVLDWENVRGRDGNVIPYSKENCYELLRDPELHDFFEELQEQANSLTNFRMQEREESAKD